MPASLASLITFSVVILTAVVEPKLVVPNLPDLTIKTRYTSGDQFSEVRTLYLNIKKSTASKLEADVRGRGDHHHRLRGHR
jgi:hypothetical protein